MAEAKLGVGVSGRLQNPPLDQQRRSSRSGRVRLRLPGYEYQQPALNSSRFSQCLHILPSQLEAGGSCPQHRYGQRQAGLEHTFPQIWGGHGAGGAAAQSHFLILAYVLLVTFRSILQLSSFLINRPDGSSLACHPLLSCAVY